jgi:hypothetical protein
MTKECFSSEQAYRGHVGEIVREHCELIEAIRDRDGDRSEVARSHADLARKRVSESLTQIMTPAMGASRAKASGYCAAATRPV